MFRVIVIFLSDDMAKIVLKSCETCNASTLLHTPAGDVWPFLFFKHTRTSSLKLSVPYEKDATTRSDSKQRIMSLQDRMEPYGNGSNR